jgi:hypothetical protein
VLKRENTSINVLYVTSVVVGPVEKKWEPSTLDRRHKFGIGAKYCLYLKFGKHQVVGTLIVCSKSRNGILLFVYQSVEFYKLMEE